MFIGVLIDDQEQNLELANKYAAKRKALEASINSPRYFFNSKFLLSRIQIYVKN